jgi:Mg/Co/Ni transporter MgtE
MEKNVVLQGIVPLLSEDSLLINDLEPKRDVQELKDLLHQFYEGTGKKDVVKGICIKLRSIESSVCRKYEFLPEERKKEMDIGDMGETLDAIQELNGSLKWIYRFPSLFLTVIIASSCIPLASQLDKVIEEHPILGGFPPAISAAAGCIGIQNTAIIIRALGSKLIRQSHLIVFLRYVFISFALSLSAAFVESLVAWVVVSSMAPEDSNFAAWSSDRLLKDVPIVIFFAMFITGSLAGIIGAGIPLLVTYVAERIDKHADPAHWVGPIETVAQELSATLLTFWIADTFVFPDIPESTPIQ